MHRIKPILLTLLLLISTVYVNAQQLPQYTQFMVNDFAMNPAIAGTQPYFQAESDNRFQWIGITDAPRTYMLTFNGPITEQHIGIGAYVFTDITGPTRRIGFTSCYSYHMKITDGLNVSLGLSAGLLQFAVDGSQVNLDQPNDQALANNLEEVIVPDLGFGFYLYGDKFYFGASAPQIIESKLSLTSFSDAQNQLATHFYITGGYNFTFGDWGLDPCLVVKYVTPAPVQFDLGARILYKQKIWIGGGFRTLDAAYAMIGYTYQDYLTIGYSYDYPISDIRQYTFGTNEIFIAIKFNRQPTPERKAQM